MWVEKCERRSNNWSLSVFFSLGDVLFLRQVCVLPKECCSNKRTPDLNSPDPSFKAMDPQSKRKLAITPVFDMRWLYMARLHLCCSFGPPPPSRCMSSPQGRSFGKIQESIVSFVVILSRFLSGLGACSMFKAQIDQGMIYSSFHNAPLKASDHLQIYVEICWLYVLTTCCGLNCKMGNDLVLQFEN